MKKNQNEKGKMDDLRIGKKTKKVNNSTIDKEELCVLLNKIFHDFNMIDIKIEEILDPKILDKSSLGSITRKLQEANAQLNAYAALRKRKIEELLNTLLK